MIVLEVLWELNHDLAEAVKVLDENGRPLLFVVIAVVLAAPEVELVTERDPVLLNNHGQSLYRSVIRINHLLCKCTKLRRPVPTIGTVHQNIHSFLH